MPAGLVAAVVLLASGCAGATRTGDAAAPEQVLRVVTVNMPRSLDPTSIDAQRILENGLAEPLIALNDDGTLAPALATSWTAVEPTVWELQLQEGVRFWSGTPLDAAAVKASLERHQRLNKRVTSTLKGLTFEVTGPLTLRIHTPKPDPGFAFRLTTSLGIDNAAADDAAGEGANTAPDLTGYFIPTAFVPGESLTAEWNPDYRIQPDGPHLQRIEARLGSDAQARLLALRSGDADGEYNVEVEQRQQYERDPEDFTVLAQAPTTRNIWMNIAKVPALADPVVRRALDVSVDRGALISGLNRGYAVPATGHFPAGLPYALGQGTPTTPDVEGADALLDGAGWTRGADGIRTKDGQRLQFRMLTYPIFQPLAIALQSQWKEIGVAIELAPVETTASNQLMLDGNFEMATYCSCGTATGDLAGQLRSYYRSDVVTNYGRYSNPQVDRLLDELAGEFDPARQQDLARQVQQLVYDDHAILYLFNSTQWATAYTSAVRGVDPNRSKWILPGMWVAGA
ncbi:ABC transporter substrate-binding protein [Pseudonocardia sp. WMMC193]|uniref:ABC transporter substrate-binding protein n=1 Tax=Pseudonocardia sp. WMMC193 TaxID=2911965 RepID=UPI001F491915|nr:ABC transporter substrate-binding protein [Pseudonocardia sp. WMMC193]MCF7547850.1 ABC transporter substrate-binding protein [Pseudonocardia sp. WMMC193]